MPIYRRKILTSLLEGLLYIISITGIVFFSIVMDKAPSWVIQWKLIFIITHKILGYIFFILVLAHVFSHRKWYKAWSSEKIKKTKNNMVTKSVSVLLLLIIIFFLFEGMLPRAIYASGHSIIGTAWVLLMIYHIRFKRNLVKKQIKCRKKKIFPGILKVE